MMSCISWWSSDDLHDVTIRSSSLSGSSHPKSKPITYTVYNVNGGTWFYFLDQKTLQVGSFLFKKKKRERCKLKDTTYKKKRDLCRCIGVSSPPPSWMLVTLVDGMLAGWLHYTCTGNLLVIKFHWQIDADHNRWLLTFNPKGDQTGLSGMHTEVTGRGSLTCIQRWPDGAFWHTYTIFPTGF